MPTLKQLRLEAGLSINQLAKLSKLDRQTVDRAEKGEGVRDVKAYALVTALGNQLGRSIKLEEVEGLIIL